MNTLVEIKERNERDWRRLILQREAQLLKRERRHLQTKALERQLTIWERERLEQVSLELQHVTQKLTRLGSQFKQFARSA